MPKTSMLSENNFNEKELVAIVGRPFDLGDDLDEIGYSLALDASESNGLGMRNIWEQVKLEFRALICTEDPRYTEVRLQARTFSHKSTTVFVSFLSAALGAAIGMSAVVLLPLVSLLLMASIKIGTETFCQLQN